MPRKRYGWVPHSREELDALARRYRGLKEEPRVRMLQLLEGDATLTMSRVAVLIDCSERTIRRWWRAYQAGGLEALLLDETSPADRAMVAEPAPARRENYDTIPQHVSRFLNALPVVADTVQWIRIFRDALRTLLGDVDHISVNVDIYFREDGGSGMNPVAFVTDHVGSREHGRASQTAVINRSTGSQGAAMFATMSEKGFPVGSYHPPLIFDYDTSDGAYIGSILLWRDIAQRAISEKTERMMKQLEPFLIFLLSDCAARRRHQDPDLQIFTQIIDVVGDRERLTARQRDVLLQHLLGKAHPEIATALGITVATVRKHIHRIYQETGATSLNELIARSFAPIHGARKPRSKRRG